MSRSQVRWSAIWEALKALPADRPCVGQPLDVFFGPEDRGRQNCTETRARVQRAKAICACCPYRATLCMELAMVEIPVAGRVIAGMTEEERVAEMARRRRSGHAPAQRQAVAS